MRPPDAKRTRSGGAHATVALALLTGCTPLVGRDVVADGRAIDAQALEALPDAPRDEAIPADCSWDAGLVRGERDPDWHGGTVDTTLLHLHRGAIIDSTGRTYVFGSTYNCIAPSSGEDFSLIRHRSDGSVDTTFGMGGQVCFERVEPGNAGSQLMSAAFDHSGRLYVVGQSGLAHDTAAVVMRLDEIGRVDPSFNGGLAVFYQPTLPASVHTTGEFAALGIAITDDAIFVAGGDYVGLGWIAKFDLDGAADQRFAESLGAVDSTVNSWYGFAHAGNWLYVAGTRLNDQALVVRRIAMDGVPDLAFGHNGVASALTGQFARPRVVAVQPDEAILVAGSSQDADINRALGTVVRFRADGSLDRTYGASGAFISRYVFNPDYTLGATAVTCDGRVLLGGAYNTTSATSYGVVEWLDARGVLDESVALHGAYIGPAPGHATFAIQADPTTRWMQVLSRHGSGAQYTINRFVP